MHKVRKGDGKMSNHGDIPACKINGKVHILPEPSKTLCGLDKSYVDDLMRKYYKNSTRFSKRINIIFRSIKGITCEKCLKLYNKAPQDGAEGKENE